MSVAGLTADLSYIFAQFLNDGRVSLLSFLDAAPQTINMPTLQQKELVASGPVDVPTEDAARLEVVGET